MIAYGMPQSWAEKQDRLARKRRDRVLVWGGGAVVASLVTAILAFFSKALAAQPTGGRQAPRGPRRCRTWPPFNSRTRSLTARQVHGKGFRMGWPLICFRHDTPGPDRADDGLAARVDASVLDGDLLLALALPQCRQRALRARFSPSGVRGPVLMHRNAAAAVRHPRREARAAVSSLRPASARQQRPRPDVVREGGAESGAIRTPPHWKLECSRWGNG